MFHPKSISFRIFYFKDLLLLLLLLYWVEFTSEAN